MQKLWIAAGVMALAGTAVARADVLVEFSLYTETSWTDDYYVADVTMTIEGIDLMGFLPEGDSTLAATVWIETAWGEFDFYNGDIEGSLWSADGGWGTLGFDFGVDALTQFGGGGNSINMEWSWVDTDEEPYFSYGLAVWMGGFAEYLGSEMLYIGWPIVETTIPAPAAVALLGIAGLASRRRRRC